MLYNIPLDRCVDVKLMFIETLYSQNLENITYLLPDHLHLIKFQK